MLKRRWAVPGLVLVGGLGLWLLIAGPRNLLGFDGGNASIALLAAVTWTSLYLLGTTPRTDIDAVVSPGEWKAWIGVAFMAVAVAYFVIHLQAFRTGPAADNDAAAVVRQLVLLLIAWSVLLRVLSARWKGVVEQDERDREIARNAKAWGRGALTACLLVLAVTLGFSPEDRLQWATHFMLANLMILVLMVGALCECAAGAVHYWRDRH